MQIAHGYAKATGKPMAVILHNLVGLLHASMAIYYAYLDRVPIFIIGRDRPDGRGQAPAAHRLDPHRAGAGQRRPRLRQMGLPADLDRRRAGILRARLFDHDDRAARARSTCATTRRCRRRRRPTTSRCRRSTRSRRRRRWRPIRAPSRRSPRSCSRPSTRCCCRNMPAGAPGGFESIVELAELTGAAVWDINNALNFPNKHPLCLSMDKASLQATPTWCSASTCKRLGKAAHRTQQHQAHPRNPAAGRVRFRRDRLRRGRHQQMGDGLLPHAAVLGAGAGRHLARHPGAHPHLQEKIAANPKLQKKHRRPQGRDRQAP